MKRIGFRGGWTAVVLVMGCGGAPPQPEEPAAAIAPAPLNARERLSAGGVGLTVSPFDSRGQIQARRTQLDAAYFPVPLRTHQGQLSVRTFFEGETELVEVEGLELELEEISFTSAQVPPHGLGLSRVQLIAGAPLRAPIQWLGAAAEGSASLGGRFRVKGMLHTSSGAESPFDEQQFDFVPLKLELSSDAAGNLEARFRLEREGATWSWEGLLDTGSFELSGRALENRPAAF